MNFYLMKSYILSVLSISFFVCAAGSATAQKKRAQILQAELASGYGSVHTLDDEILKGKITFNDNESIVTVEKDRESRSFTARKAQGFEFDDTKLARHRVFYVLDYTNQATGSANPAFFEVLAEFESFAVLAKIDRVEVVTMPRANSVVSIDKDIVAYQTETIFIMNASGIMEPYVTLTEKETEGDLLDTRSNRKRYINRNLLREYTTESYAELEAFAKTNDLNFKVKEDLIKILAYYKELLDN